MTVPSPPAVRQGLYRISKTLELPAGASLVGLSQAHSIIVPTSAGFVSSRARPAPLLRTAPGTPASIAFVGLAWPSARLSFCCTPPLPSTGVSIGVARECQQSHRALGDG